MRTIYETILDNVDAQANKLDGKIVLDAWMNKCVEVSDNEFSHTEFKDITIKQVNDKFIISCKENRWNGLTCAIDNTFETLPLFELEEDKRPAFDAANVSYEVNPDVIFDKCPALINVDKWKFYNCGVDYITSVFAKLKSICNRKYNLPIGISVYDPKGNCDFSKLAEISETGFVLSVGVIKTSGKDVLIPAAMLQGLVVAKTLTIDADPRWRVVDNIRYFGGDSNLSTELYNAVVNELNFINIPTGSHVSVSVYFKNCKIGNMDELAETYIYDEQSEGGIVVWPDAKTKKRSGMNTKVKQVDILGRDIKSGDLVLYPDFNTSSFGTHSGLHADVSKVLKVTDNMIEVDGKRVRGNLCLIIPDFKAVTVREYGRDMCDREINVGDIVAYCGSEHQGNTHACIMLDEVDKVSSIIKLKNSNRRFYGTELYLIDKQWLKENDKGHSFKKLY